MHEHDDPTAVQELPQVTAADHAHETEQQARERARRCNDAIADVLAQHRCRLVPMFARPETVGGEPASKLLLTATYGVIPDYGG